MGRRVVEHRLLVEFVEDDPDNLVVRTGPAERKSARVALRQDRERLTPTPRLRIMETV